MEPPPALTLVILHFPLMISSSNDWINPSSIDMVKQWNHLAKAQTYSYWNLLDSIYMVTFVIKIILLCLIVWRWWPLFSSKSASPGWRMVAICDKFRRINDPYCTHEKPCGQKVSGGHFASSRRRYPTLNQSRWKQHRITTTISMVAPNLKKKVRLGPFSITYLDAQVTWESLFPDQ